MKHPATVRDIAKVCHEANRAFCKTLGDNSQPSWDEASDWHRSSAIGGASYHLCELEAGRDPSPSDSHDNWLAVKEMEGWVYGEEKDPVAKTHPCFLPYSELPASQKQKDYIFGAIVKSFFDSKNYFGKDDVL